MAAMEKANSIPARTSSKSNFILADVWKGRVYIAFICQIITFQNKKKIMKLDQE